MPSGESTRSRFNALGPACLLLGRLDQAQSWSDRVIESLPGQRGFAAHAPHLLGEIAAYPDRFDATLAEVLTGYPAAARRRTSGSTSRPRSSRPARMSSWGIPGQLTRMVAWVTPARC